MCVDEGLKRSLKEVSMSLSKLADSLNKISERLVLGPDLSKTIPRQQLVDRVFNYVAEKGFCKHRELLIKFNLTSDELVRIENDLQDWLIFVELKPKRGRPIRYVVLSSKFYDFCNMFNEYVIRVVKPDKWRRESG